MGSIAFGALLNVFVPGNGLSALLFVAGGFELAIEALALAVGAVFWLIWLVRRIGTATGLVHAQVTPAVQVPRGSTTLSPPAAPTRVGSGAGVLTPEWAPELSDGLSFAAKLSTWDYNYLRSAFAKGALVESRLDRETNDETELTAEEFFTLGLEPADEDDRASWRRVQAAARLVQSRFARPGSDALVATQTAAAMCVRRIPDAGKAYLLMERSLPAAWLTSFDVRFSLAACRAVTAMLVKDAIPHADFERWFLRAFSSAATGLNFFRSSG
jgi:hypothetical protein